MKAHFSQLKASRLLMMVIIGLILIKIAAGWWTGSISILAQAMDSLLDLAAALITFIAIRIAMKPPDEEHPFGHGKAEDVAGIAQCVLIFVTSALIIYSAILRIIQGTTIQLTYVGIAVMAVSIVVSVLLSRYLLRIARQTDSIALEANARNISADIYSAFAVLAGLLIVQFTGSGIIDAIIAIVVALYILRMAYYTFRKPFSRLMDTKLQPSEENVIKECILKYSAEVVEYHKLRTRQSGNQRYIDLHVVMSKGLDLEKAHNICNCIEDSIRDSLPRASITIHIEPCTEECDQCSVVCNIRENR